MAVKEEHIIQRGGKDFVLYAGLVAEAHDQYDRFELVTTPLEMPTDDNGWRAYWQADFVGWKGEQKFVFRGHGDASPKNVGAAIVPHLWRMGETRAKARTLRDATNIGYTSLEELADEEGGPPADTTPPQSRQGRQGSQGGRRQGSSQGQGGQRSQGGSSGATRGGAKSAPNRKDKMYKSRQDVLRALIIEKIGEPKIAAFEDSEGPIAELSRDKGEEWIKRFEQAEARVEQSEPETEEEDFDDEDPDIPTEEEFEADQGAASAEDSGLPGDEDLDDIPDF